MNTKILDYYREFGLFTDPGMYKSVLAGVLPDDVKKIGLLVRSQIIHRMTLKNGNTGSNSDLRYGDMTRVPWYRQPEDDIFPTAAAMISELYRRDPRGFVLDRNTENKLILTCRFTAILMASLLKMKSIPARVRSGFAPYFHVHGHPDGKSDDHWITQYWNTKESRWVSIDVDGSLEGYRKIDPYDMPQGSFDFAADAWLSVREGKVDAERFWNAGGNGGLLAIAWALFYDFHCLMNNEIIYTHTPQMAHFGEFSKITDLELKEIDALAGLLQKPDDNFEELRKVWETKKEFRLLRGGLL